MNIFRGNKHATDASIGARDESTGRDRFGETGVLNFKDSESEDLYNRREPVSADTAKVYWRMTACLYGIIILYVVLSY